jgi:MerR family transcriptional regulator, redox-sensitive transcriptional activator SoxR
MSDLLAIGEVGRRAGLAPSAIRYYERLGLLPKPARAGGKRRYDASVLEWLSLIALAREAGFTMAEVKRLVTGFTPGTRPAARWQELATRKLAEIDAMVARAERMRAVLRVALDCGCFRLADCSALLEAGPVDGQSPCVLPVSARVRPGDSLRDS